jgi:hypothetical protein
MTEMLEPDDLANIREIGSRVIRNVSLFMDNPFSYAHLISLTMSDLEMLEEIRKERGLQGDGLLPAHPVPGNSQQGQGDISSILIDAGFARLREAVDSALQPKGGKENE